MRLFMSSTYFAASYLLTAKIQLVGNFVNYVSAFIPKRHLLKDTGLFTGGLGPFADLEHRTSYSH